MGQTASALPEDDEQSLKNVKFYKNEEPCVPDGVLIDEIHTKWFGDWSLLEVNHSYIQWLFPIREGGLNFSAQPLSKNEASIFRATPEMQQRIIKSYQMMLDFYGMVLVDLKTGVVARNPKTYKNRYAHLNNSFHNYLRITRILKCLGLVGLEHYKKPLLKHMVIEIFKYELLDNADHSCLKFWIPTLRKVDDIIEVDSLATTIIGKTVNRNNCGNGDEEGENWATQYYKPTFTFEKSDTTASTSNIQSESPPQNISNGNEETVNTPQSNPSDTDVLTFNKDPYENIRKNFKDDQKSLRFGGLSNLIHPRRSSSNSSSHSDLDQSSRSNEAIQNTKVDRTSSTYNDDDDDYDDDDDDGDDNDDRFSEDKNEERAR